MIFTPVRVELITLLSLREMRDYSYSKKIGTTLSPELCQRAESIHFTWKRKFDLINGFSLPNRASLVVLTVEIVVLRNCIVNTGTERIKGLSFPRDNANYP